MSRTQAKHHLHLISDSTGETLHALTRAVLDHFEKKSAENIAIHMYVFTRTQKDLQAFIDSALQNEGFVMETIRNPEIKAELYEFCHKNGLHVLPILDHILDNLIEYLNWEDPRNTEYSLLRDPAPDMSLDDAPPVKLKGLTQRKIRESLAKDYDTPSGIVQFLVEQTQLQISQHRIIATPNDPEQLRSHLERGEYLNVMLASLVNLHQRLPPGAPYIPTDEQATDIKAKLEAVVKSLDALIRILDEDTGTYGALWKIGLISTIGGLLSVFGVSFATGSLIASGPIGINTIRLIIDRR